MNNKCNSLLMIFVLLSSNVLFAMEEKSQFTQEELELLDEARRIKVADRLRESSLKQQPKAVTKKASFLFSIPFINMRVLTKEAGPILASYFMSLNVSDAEPSSETDGEFPEQQDDLGLDYTSLIRAFLKSIKFTEVPLYGVKKIGECSSDKIMRNNLIGPYRKLFVTDLFDSKKLVESLAQLIIYLKDNGMEFIENGWEGHRVQLGFLYGNLAKCIDPRKKQRLEINAQGAIVWEEDVVTFFKLIDGLFTPGGVKFTFKLASIPLIGKYLQPYIEETNLNKLIDALNDSKKYQRKEIIEMVIDCIKFEPFLPTDDAVETVKVKEEGCRVLLNLLFNMHSNSGKAASFATANLLTILGEHSLARKKELKDLLGEVQQMETPDTKGTATGTAQGSVDNNNNKSN